MKIIREPAPNPFGPEHEEMYEMYLDLSKRFQEMREEIRDRSDLVQPPTPTPEPVSLVEEPPVVKQSPTGRRSMGQPYVLVPVSSVNSLPSDVKD